MQPQSEFQGSQLPTYLNAREYKIHTVQSYSEMHAGTLISFIFATAFFTIRMAAKSLRLGGGWGADDYTLMAAYVSPDHSRF